MIINLVEFEDEIDISTSLIREFWKEHNHDFQSFDEANQNLLEWTSEGHKFYLIKRNDEYIGFVHLGSRGGYIDWLEDLFVIPTYQNQGIGTSVIELVEEIVKQYSSSLYIEVAARNERALRLYHKNGFRCLNTITVRKDFSLKDKVIKKEKIDDLEFEIKKRDC